MACGRSVGQSDAQPHPVQSIEVGPRSLAGGTSQKAWGRTGRTGKETEQQEERKESWREMQAAGAAPTLAGRWVPAAVLGLAAGRRRLPRSSGPVAGAVQWDVAEGVGPDRRRWTGKETEQQEQKESWRVAPAAGRC
ncbi:hypothetical protein PLESTM_001081200 [Pleodorina starrii]|nr:hypothetical protein PLESTM_001081200 [Pleodorina starrii]